MEPQAYYIGSLIVSCLAIICSTILTILNGPVRAGRIAHEIARERAKIDRKVDLLRRVFMTRGGLRTHPDHVWAMNLVPMDFGGVNAVINAWRTYRQHLDMPPPQEEPQLGAFILERTRRLTELIYAMGTDVGINFDRLDIQDHAYFPQAWANREWEEQQLRLLSLDMLRGLRPLRVAPASLAGQGPFPPAPNPEAAQVPQNR